jgi:DNA-binding PadR family transcriptional regulator
LREHFAPLLGKPPGDITPGQMTYQLRRLRLHGLIVRQPKSHRYRVTDFGLRVALFFTRTYARLLRPGLAHVTAETETANSPLRHAFNQVESILTQWIAREKLAA